ncbi:hypothetical protein F5883DRAFT_189611, partial [Diaporthe sp. PMI_573]
EVGSPGWPHGQPTWTDRQTDRGISCVPVNPGAGDAATPCFDAPPGPPRTPRPLAPCASQHSCLPLVLTPSSLLLLLLLPHSRLQCCLTVLAFLPLPNGASKPHSAGLPCSFEAHSSYPQLRSSPPALGKARTRSLRYKSHVPPSQLIHALLLGPAVDQLLHIAHHIRQFLHPQGRRSCCFHHCRLSEACLVAPSTLLTYTTERNHPEPLPSIRGQAAQQWLALFPLARPATRPTPPTEACGPPNNRPRALTPRQRSTARGSL